MRYIRVECRSCFDHADFTAENIACGFSTECMKRRVGDGRTIYTYIHTLRAELYSLCGARSDSPQLFGPRVVALDRFHCTHIHTHLLCI